MSQEEETIASDPEGEAEPGETESAGVEEDIQVQTIVLNLELIKPGLSILAKINHGLSYAYTRFQAIDKSLSDISILAKYKYLRYVNVSGNALTDISCLNELQSLLRIDADRNNLEAINLGNCPYLQIANFSENKLTSTSEFNYPSVRHLNLNSNKITEITGFDTSKFDNLRILELRNNQLITANISLPKLQELYLAANQITAIEGIDTMQELAILHLRDNPLKQLNGFSENLSKLKYLNFRGAQVEDINEITKLKVVAGSLRSLNFLDNPVTESDNYRLETLILLRMLDKLDKEKFNEDERLEANEMAEAKLEREAETIQD